MGVNIDDTDLSWRGPGGMEGRVNNGFGGGKSGDKGGGKGIVAVTMTALPVEAVAT